MKTRKTFFYSSIKLYCYRMFLHMGSGDLSSSLFWFTIDMTENGRGKRNLLFSIVYQKMIRLQNFMTALPVILFWHYIKVILILGDFSKY